MGIDFEKEAKDIWNKSQNLKEKRYKLIEDFGRKMYELGREQGFLDHERLQGTIRKGKV